MSKKNNPVVFISSAISPSKYSKVSFEYFTKIAVLLSQYFEPQYDLIIKIPPDNDEQSQHTQLSMLDNTIAFNKKYSGIIIAPIGTSLLEESIYNYISKRKADCQKCPILTIDKGYIKDKCAYFKDRNDNPPPFVMSDGKIGGKRAAESLIKYFEKNPQINPTVLILKGLEGSQERVDGFIERWKEKYNNEPTLFRREIPFKRDIAKQEIYSFLQDHSDFINKMHGVFCCNDEMALGVREALYEFKRNNPGIFKEIKWVKIVGFDGINEVKRLIDEKDCWIINTIDVEIEEQVNKLVQMFITLKKRAKRERVLEEPMYSHPCDLHKKPEVQFNQ